MASVRFGSKTAKKDFIRHSGPVGGIAVARGKAANQMVSAALKQAKTAARKATIVRGKSSIEAFNRMVEKNQIRGPKISSKHLK